MSATQATLTCPYCSHSKLKGQTGLSVHIAKSQPCKEAQEKMALVQLHVPTESATSVLVLHDCLVSYISDCFINPGQLDSSGFPLDQDMGSKSSRLDSDKAPVSHTPTPWDDGALDTASFTFTPMDLDQNVTDGMF